jgi:hypothetical protein
MGKKREGRLRVQGAPVAVAVAVGEDAAGASVVNKVVS